MFKSGGDVGRLVEKWVRYGKGCLQLISEVRKAGWGDRGILEIGFEGDMHDEVIESANVNGSSSGFEKRREEREIAGFNSGARSRGIGEESGSSRHTYDCWRSEKGCDTIERTGNVIETGGRLDGHGDYEGGGHRRLVLRTEVNAD